MSKRNRSIKDLFAKSSAKNAKKAEENKSNESKKNDSQHSLENEAASSSQKTRQIAAENESENETMRNTTVRFWFTFCFLSLLLRKIAERLMIERVYILASKSESL